MKITSDWHIHSQNSCDQAAMPMATLVKRAAEFGITDYGITDHLHSPYNLPDIEASRAEYLSINPGPRFHFGIEVSVMSKWELAEIAAGKREKPTYGIREGGPAWAEPALCLTREMIARYGIEYVVGGTHWPLYVPFEREAVTKDYHRQNMFLAAHPLVTIVAHPWWWHPAYHWADDKGMMKAEPWFDDFEAIPRSMHEEFAESAIQHGKVVEINVSACLLNERYPEAWRRQYAEYCGWLRERGVKLSIASDCHEKDYVTNFERAAGMLAAVGIRDEDLWRLAPRK